MIYGLRRVSWMVPSLVRWRTVSFRPFKNTLLQLESIDWMDWLGIHITIYLQCCYHLCRDPAKSRRRYIFLAYITTNFILASLWFSSILVCVQNAFIDHSDFPGGPTAYYLSTYTSPITLLGVIATIVGNWSTDALLVSILYSTCKLTTPR